MPWLAVLTVGDMQAAVSPASLRILHSCWQIIGFMPSAADSLRVETLQARGMCTHVSGALRPPMR